MRVLAVLLALAIASIAQAAPLSSAFTYQGELFDAGAPLNGQVDLRFTPYADASNPTLLGPPIVVEDVLVSAGVFTARVDFGAGFFVGDAVFLEIAVRPADIADPNAFEALSPRQEVTAAPYTLKPAPGSVTDMELAGDAVGGPQIADSSVASADIADGSVTPQDLALAGGGFDASLWRVGGNTGTAGVLGVLDANQALNLFAPLGVTVNGSRFNTNTELTLRGNPNAVETNADLALWPRGGEAFFNIGVLGQTPVDARMQIHSVGTNPFTTYVPRLQLDFDGALGIGGANPAPEGKLHITGVDQGFDSPADSSEALELVIEDSDAQLGLYSSAGGGVGSVIGLGEMNAGVFVNQWGLMRATSQAGSSLQLTFGTNTAAAANPVLARFGTNGAFALNGAPINIDTELQVSGQAAIPGSPGDFMLIPQAGTAAWNFQSAGTNESDTSLTLSFLGPTINYEPRLRFAANGGAGFGRFASPTQADSYVFADDSVATLFAPSAANQFVVRAAGGAAINGTPASAITELTVHSNSTTAGEGADILLRPGGTTQGYRISGRNAAPVVAFTTSDPGGGNDERVRLLIDEQGRLSVNPSTGPGTVQANSVPLRVGTTGNMTNGNSAFLSAGGAWTNGSSRTFKEAFTALDVQDILARVLSLPVTRWHYRGGEGGWHIGPMAEDFAAAFGLGEDERYIGTVDADGVALAAIQGLAARHEARAESLARENATLRETLAALAERVEALERGE